MTLPPLLLPLEPIGAPLGRGVSDDPQTRPEWDRSVVERWLPEFVRDERATELWLYRRGENDQDPILVIKKQGNDGTGRPTELLSYAMWELQRDKNGNETRWLKLSTQYQNETMMSVKLEDSVYDLQSKTHLAGFLGYRLTKFVNILPQHVRYVRFYIKRKPFTDPLPDGMKDWESTVGEWLRLAAKAPKELDSVTIHQMSEDRKWPQRTAMFLELATRFTNEVRYNGGTQISWPTVYGPRNIDQREVFFTFTATNSATTMFVRQATQLIGTHFNVQQDFITN